MGLKIVCTEDSGSLDQSAWNTYPRRERLSWKLKVEYAKQKSVGTGKKQVHFRKQDVPRDGHGRAQCQSDGEFTMAQL